MGEVDVTVNADQSVVADQIVAGCDEERSGDYRETVACGVGFKKERGSDALRTISVFTPVTNQPFGQSSVRSPPDLQKAREVPPKSPMVESCRRPNGLPTLTVGGGFGMRSYCQSRIGDLTGRCENVIAVRRRCTLTALVTQRCKMPITRFAKLRRSDITTTT